TGTADVDTFSFTLPSYCAPSLPAGARSLFSLYLLPTGPYADGATTPPGKGYPPDAAHPGPPIAQTSGSAYPDYAHLLPPPPPPPPISPRPTCSRSSTPPAPRARTISTWRSWEAACRISSRPTRAATTCSPAPRRRPWPPRRAPITTSTATS